MQPSQATYQFHVSGLTGGPGAVLVPECPACLVVSRSWLGVVAVVLWIPYRLHLAKGESPAHSSLVALVFCSPAESLK